MAKCKDCFHCEICAKQNRLVQIDAHTWDEYELLDDVEKFCEHFENTADVVPRAEVAKEIFEEIEVLFSRHKEGGYYLNGAWYPERLDLDTEDAFAELKKKYTEGEKC